VGIGNDALNSITKLKEQIPLLQDITNDFFDIVVDPATDFGLEITDTQIIGDNYNDDRIANNGETLKLTISISNTSSIDYKNILVKPLVGGQFVDGTETLLLPDIPSNTIFTLEGENSILLQAEDNIYEEVSHKLTFFDSTFSIYQIIPYTLPIEQLYFTPFDIDTLKQTFGVGDAVLGLRYVLPHESKTDSYRVEITDQYYNSQDILQDGLGINLTNITSGILLLDRFMLPDEYGFDYPITEGFKLLLLDSKKADINYVAVVANANGPINPPVDGLAWWRFPNWLVDYQDYNNNTNPSVFNSNWLLNTHPSYGPAGPETFYTSVVAVSGGEGSSTQGMKALIPYDYECRFTNQGKAFDIFNGTGIHDVPFEWWNIGIGTPDDQRDDYQLISFFLDDDVDGKWGLTPNDHESSGGNNDPYTDRIYVHAPTNDTPGTQGYDEFFANVIPNGSNVNNWNGGPGENDPGGPMDTWNVFSRLVFMNWNGGDVYDHPNYNALEPETGTIFRIVTTKPLTVGDTFTFSTMQYNGHDPSNTKQFELFQNYPNPFNDETHIKFYVSKYSDFKLTIYDLLGRQIINYDIKQHSPGYHTIRWNGKSNNGNQLPSGLYIVQMTAGDFIQSKKLLLLK